MSALLIMEDVIITVPILMVAMSVLVLLVLNWTMTTTDAMVQFSNLLSTIFYLFLFSDINECLNNNGICSQNCINTIGSYHCSCGNGYTLHDNEHACDGELKYTLCTVLQFCLHKCASQYS